MKLPKIIIIILVVAVLGAVVSLATGIWDPTWNPFGPSSAEGVMKRMVQRMSEVKTASSQGEMHFEIREGKTGEAIGMALAFEAHGDATDPAKEKSATDLNIRLLFNDKDFSFGFKAIIIDETIYLNIASVPDIPEDAAKEMAEVGLDLDQLINQWIKIDQESIENLYEAFDLDPSEQGQLFGQDEKHQKMMEEAAEELAELMNKRFLDLFKVKETFSDKTIEGMGVYHYGVSLDKEGVKKIIPEIIEIYEDPIFEILKDQQGAMFASMIRGEWVSSKKDILEELNRGIDSFFEAVGDISAELWIGKEDYYLYKIKLEKAVDISEMIPGEAGGISFGFDFNSYNFNQPITIEAPQEYKTFDEIFIPIFEIMMMDYMGAPVYHYQNEADWEDWGDREDWERYIQEPSSSELPLSFFGSIARFLQASLFSLPF